MRLQLKPGLTVVRRAPGTVQIGLDPRYGTVVDGLTPADLDLLDELSGGLEDARLAVPGDIPPAQSPHLDRILRARMLIGLLTDTGVLQRARAGRATLGRIGPLRRRLAPDAAAWSLTHPTSGDGWELLARRRRAVVELQGSGRTAMALAATLAAAGVGDVRATGPDDVTSADLGAAGALPPDVGLTVAEAVARVIGRVLGRAPIPDPITGPDPVDEGTAPRPPDLVVLVERGAADPTRGDRLLAADVAHLSVVIRETSVVVGPLVVPGRGACLRCLDLHRTERDPQWPVVLAQLLRPGARLPREETAIAQVAAGVAALQVLAHLDGCGVPAAAGATLEIELPDGLASRRPWPAHPSCGCSWPPAPGRSAAPTAQDARPDPPTTTMLG